MAKSKRVNLSVPGALASIYEEWSRLTGVSVPSVMVQALSDQSSFLQQRIKRFKWSPRDALPDLVVVEASGGVKAASASSGKGVGSSVKLSRRQRLRQRDLKGKTGA